MCLNLLTSNRGSKVTCKVLCVLVCMCLRTEHLHKYQFIRKCCHQNSAEVQNSVCACGESRSGRLILNLPFVVGVLRLHLDSVSLCQSCFSLLLLSLSPHLCSHCFYLLFFFFQIWNLHSSQKAFLVFPWMSVFESYLLFELLNQTILLPLQSCDLFLGFLLLGRGEFQQGDIGVFLTYRCQECLLPAQRPIVISKAFIFIKITSKERKTVASHTFLKAFNNAPRHKKFYEIIFH